MCWFRGPTSRYCCAVECLDSVAFITYLLTSAEKQNHPAVHFHADDSGLCLPLPARQASSCKRRGHCSKTSSASRPTRNMPTDRFHPEAAAPPRSQSRNPRNGTRPAQARAANSRRPTSTNPTSAWVWWAQRLGSATWSECHTTSSARARRWLSPLEPRGAALSKRVSLCPERWVAVEVAGS